MRRWSPSPSIDRQPQEAAKFERLRDDALRDHELPVEDLHQEGIYDEGVKLLGRSRQP
jgi:hypothetical protein